MYPIRYRCDGKAQTFSLGVCLAKDDKENKTTPPPPTIIIMIIIIII